MLKQYSDVHSSRSSRSVLQQSVARKTKVKTKQRPMWQGFVQVYEASSSRSFLSTHTHT
jgi:hypothetical protein